MMALNRYKIRHKAKLGNRAAIRVGKLLKRTDHLLSIILIANNFINILVSSLATMIALRLFGDAGIFIATIALTFSLLIFGEVTPKMVATMYPERLALIASFPLKLLIKIIYPFMMIINGISTGLIRLMGINPQNAQQDHLSQEELRTLVHESGSRLTQKRQGMLLGVLDLDAIDVDQIMTPRNEITGIDLDDDIDTIVKTMQKIQHTRLPVYRGDINNVIGVLHMRNTAQMVGSRIVTKKAIEQAMSSPYYVPEGTSLHTQLYNFQKEKHRLAMVVDEYGDIQGLVTLEDILEEIVGKFTTDVETKESDITLYADGNTLIKGAANIREINKTLNWDLPCDGPKTLNGLITETLEDIPEGLACVEIGDYQIEILELAENKVKSAKVSVRNKQQSKKYD